MIATKTFDYNKIVEKECLVCLEDDYKFYKCKVRCFLCDSVMHYKCYKTFVKKNPNYKNKCLQCNTKSIYYEKPWWICIYL